MTVDGNGKKVKEYKFRNQSNCILNSKRSKQLSTIHSQFVITVISTNLCQGIFNIPKFPIQMNVISNMLLLLLLHMLPFATPSISIKATSTTNNSALSNGYCTSFRHVHLSSLANASTSITISFSSHPCDIPEGKYYSNDNDTNLQIPPSLGAVLIGKDAHGEAHQLVMGDNPLRYNATIHLQTPKNLEYVSEYQHHVTVNDLEPGTTYYYKCIVVEHEMVNIDDCNDDCDDVEVEETSRYLRQALAKQDSTYFYSFRTAPTSESGTSTKVAILGDLGAFDHTKETLNVLFDHLDEIDSIVLVGDLTYANGDHRKWDEWFDMLDETNIFHKKPMYIVSGNHDVEGVLATGVMYQAYENRFRMPRIQKAIIGKVTKPQDIDLNKMYRLPYDYGNSFYSYTTGMLHNIVLNSFADFEPESNQYRWLLTELESIDRHQIPWVMISVHCPIYNTFSTHRHDPQPLQMKKYLEPLFVKYHVNFVLSGHMHAYSRSKNVANDSLTSTGPMHIVLGNGGRQLNAPFQSEIPEEWVALRDHTTYGFGTIQVLNKTSALYEWVQSGRTNAASPGMNFDDAPENMTDLVYVENQYFV